MTDLGVDCSAGRPSGAALAAKGMRWSLRYIRQGNPNKLLTLAEWEDLTAHGIQVLGVSELNTHDMETGRLPGRQAALADQAWLKALGIPLEKWACAADEHLAAGGPISTAVAHAQGYADVLGPDGGVYGALELMQAAAADPIAEVLWRWMWGHEPTAAQIVALALFAWQRNTGTTVIDGVTCDINEIYRTLEDDVSVNDPLPVKRPDGTVPTLGEADGNTYLALFYGGPDTGNMSVFDYLKQIQASVAALPGAISTAEADMLAAIKALPPAGDLTDDQVQAEAAKIATALSGTLPAGIVKAIGQQLVG